MTWEYWVDSFPLYEVRERLLFRMELLPTNASEFISRINLLFLAYLPLKYFDELNFENEKQSGLH